MASLTDTYLPILILLGIALLWHHSLGAREQARRHARRLCRHSELQLLDQTVSIRRLRLQRSSRGRLQLLREYGFEVSSNGNDRLPGSLWMAGVQLQSWVLPTPPGRGANGDA